MTTTTYLPRHAAVYEGSVSQVEDGIANDRRWTERDGDPLRVEGKRRVVQA